MSSLWLRFVVVVLLVALASINSARQQQHRPRDWYCVSQTFLETTDGNLIVLQCAAALPKSEKLDVDDEGLLTTLEVARHNAMTFKQLGQENGEGKEMMDGLRMGFGQKVGQLCQKQPNIVLAPLFRESSGTTTLYGCKNIITAPEK